MKLYLPIFLVVFSNIFYHICAKSSPDDVNSFAALVVTYGVGGLISALLYYCTCSSASILHEFTKLNWTTYVLGLAIIGLEAGNIYMYKAGWPVSTGYIVQSAILAVALLLVGYMLYNEAITFYKLLGILFCMIGLYFLNK